MKKRLNLIKNIFVMLGAVLLCGCSTLTYSGDDFDKSAMQSVTTKEGFYFSTYTKQKDNAKITVGISKSQVNEVLVAYIGIDNASDRNIPVSNSNISIWAGDKLADLITSANYLTVYQSEQNEVYVGTQSLAPTITNMANMANNYYAANQSQIIRDQNASSASLRQLDDLATRIREHSISTNTYVKPMEKKYYYIFIKDDDQYPIKIQYMGLEYVFNSGAKK